MINQKPSYLAQMSKRERAASVVLAIQCFGNLKEIYLGGERQFLRIARPILRNWGVKSDDYGTIWAMVEYAIKQPRSFRSMCEEIDRQKRVPVH